MKNKFRLFLTANLVAATLLSQSCAKDESSNGGVTFDPVKVGTKTFVISTCFDDGAYYMLTSSDPKSGTISAVGNGLVVANGGELNYVNDKYLYAIHDQGGNDGVPVTCLAFDAAQGRLVQKAYFCYNSFSAWGVNGEKFLYSKSANATPSTTVSFNSTDMTKSQVTVNVAGNTSGDFGYSVAEAETYLWDYSDANDRTPETVCFVGYTRYGNDLYVSLATSGVSGYTAATNGLTSSSKSALNGTDLEDMIQNVIDNTNIEGDAVDYIAEGYGYVTYATKDGLDYTYSGTANTAASPASKACPYPLTPDVARVAIYKNVSDSFSVANTAPDAIITTDMISQAFGRTTGNPFSTIINGDDGVYLFSPGTTRIYNDIAETRYTETNAYDAVINTYATSDYTGDAGSLRIARSTNKAGVVKINPSTYAFDESSYVDIEALLDGRTFSRVWHLSGDKFLLRIMESGATTANGVYYSMHHIAPQFDTEYVILDLNTETVEPITSLPAKSELDTIKYAVGEPCFDGNSIYFTYATTSGRYVYYIEDYTSSTAAQRGLKIEANFVFGIGILEAI